MYKPADAFTTNILQIFVTRVEIILNKIYQRSTTSFSGTEFHFSKSNSTKNFISIRMQNEPDIVIMWTKDGQIMVNNERFSNLQTDLNLHYFTTIEQRIIAELIAREKELKESKESESVLSKTIENIFNSEPLGAEFERVLEDNLNKLYEN